MSTKPFSPRTIPAGKGAKAPGRTRVLPGRRKAPVQQRSRLTVDAIIEAAGQLLVESGRAAVTTNAVADRAGVSIGSLYQYFPNVDAVFVALQERHREEVMPLVHHTMARLSDPSIGLTSGIVMLMRGMVELHEADPDRLRALAEELEEPTSRTEAEQMADVTVRVLQQRTGKSEEAVRAIGWLAAIALTHIGRALVHNPPRVPLDSLFDSLARMLDGLFSGLETEGPRREDGR